MAAASLLSLRVLPDPLAVCRLPADAEVPAWAVAARFFSITRTADEMSVVCPEPSVPEGVENERGWRALQVEGSLDFSLTGVLASLAGPLAEAKIPIFVISTFETDLLLVKAERLEGAVETLRGAGHRVRTHGAGELATGSAARASKTKSDEEAAPVRSRRRSAEETEASPDSPSASAEGAAQSPQGPRNRQRDRCMGRTTGRRSSGTRYMTVCAGRVGACICYMP
jgi:hypothetical protein